MKTCENAKSAVLYSKNTNEISKVAFLSYSSMHECANVENPKVMTDESRLDWIMLIKFMNHAFVGVIQCTL